MVKKFGSNISQLRKKNELSQRELARRIEVAPSYLNEIEKGDRGVPSSGIVQRLANELKVSEEYLYDIAAQDKMQLPPDIRSLLHTRPEVLDLLRVIRRCGLHGKQIKQLSKQIEKGAVKAIILAAGMGTRMEHMTKSLPKCMAIQFDGKTLLSTHIDTLKKCGISDIAVVRGYAGKAMKSTKVRYIENQDFAENNILGSLMCAEEELEGDVIVSYSDIWYEDSVLKKLLRSDKDIAIGVDIDWKDYYEGRKNHPIEEAENVVFDSDNRVIKIGKIATEGMEVHGEFIGMMKLSHRGCELIREHYARTKKLYEGGPFQRARDFKKAYLTDLLQEMANLGVSISCEIIGSKWKEIDTIEDFQKAQESLAKMKSTGKTKTLRRKK
jgi:choline kinase/transcriptional regulator with XRE-family HTH domain